MIVNETTTQKILIIDISDFPKVLNNSTHIHPRQAVKSLKIKYDNNNQM